MDQSVLNFVIETVRKEQEEKYDKDKGKPFNQFYVDVEAQTLVLPCRKNAEHHRKRAKYYEEKLEEAEKELKEKGISLEVFDDGTGTYQHMGTALVSGLPYAGGGGEQRNFQPHVDPLMMDAVKNAKKKLVEHTNKAIKFAKEARAFSFDPTFKVRLSISDIEYFRLGEE